MERDLYLTEAPLSQTPDTTFLPQKQRGNILVKSLANPNDRRNQVTKKMLSNFPPESYYDDKKVKPGISLYKIIIETQDKRRQEEFNGPYLQLNLHPTVAFTDNVNTMIYNENGIIKTMNYISYEKYLAKLGKTEEQLKKQQEVEPMMISKCCNGILFENNIIMNTEITSKSIPRSENVISTKFVMPFASYPNIIRLFFTPKHVKNVKKNIAYKVINRKQMTQDAFKKKHRLSNQFMVNVDNQQSYIATLIKGKALQPCQTMAASLCEYLEHVLMIKVSQVVVDFIVDQNKIIFFNDIKSIRSKCKTKLWEIGTQEQIIKLASENNNQIMCRLCGMLYTKQQMQKLVTNKLIYELVSHLQNRGKKLNNVPHMKKEGLSNVCHLCYELIKAEHTLINVEREFSELMNIRQNTVERVQSKETKQQQLCFYDEQEFQMLGEQTSKYKKWRLFFYVEKLKRIPQMEINDAQSVEISLEMKFQNQKQTFGKTISNQNYDPTMAEFNMSKNWSKSMRTAQNNNVRRQSVSSRSNNLRVQSAMPHRQRFKEEQSAQDEQNEDFNFQNPIQVQQKNKSYFNDQTTCNSHSQSYFSTNLNDKSGIDNSHSTTQHRNLANNNLTRTYNLDSLKEDPLQDFSNRNIKKEQRKNINFSIKQEKDILNCSSVPSQVKIDKVKMFVFYTKAHENEGKNILNEEELQFSLSFTGLNPNNPHSKDSQTFKFAGNSSTLKCLKNKQTCQRHSLQIYLFDQGMKYCNLQLTVGMICDGIYDDEGLDLEKCDNLYWGKTYSCEPLPDQWMEVFTYGEEVPKGNMEKVLEYLEDNKFSTSPPKLLQRTNSVNYLKAFENYANSTIKQYANSVTRPMSGLAPSYSASALKKTSFVRCKTAMSRNASSFTNLFNQQQKANQPGSSNRNNYRYKNSLQEIGNEEDQNEIFDFDV